MRQLAPPSTLTASPTAPAASTTSGSDGCATTWWMSASMSIVASQLAPASTERGMPPTWTFAWRRPERSWAIERTAGGPPHGVNQVSRPSIVSNASTGARAPSSPSRSRWASSVPTNTPCEVATAQTSSSSLRATSVHAPSGSRRTIACRSATAHTPASPTASAETSRVVPKLGSGRGSPPATPNTPSLVPISSSDGVRGSLTQRPYRGLAQRRPGAYDASRWRWSVSRAMRAARPAIFCTTVKR